MKTGETIMTKPKPKPARSQAKKLARVLTPEDAFLTRPEPPL